MYLTRILFPDHKSASEFISSYPSATKTHHKYVTSIKMILIFISGEWDVLISICVQKYTFAAQTSDQLRLCTSGLQKELQQQELTL